MEIYRVEKDGMSFYVQPSQISMYAESGYDVYRQTETKIDYVAEEIRNIEMQSMSAEPEGKTIVNG